MVKDRVLKTVLVDMEPVVEIAQAGQGFGGEDGKHRN